MRGGTCGAHLSYAYLTATLPSLTKPRAVRPCRFPSVLFERFCCGWALPAAYLVIACLCGTVTDSLLCLLRWTLATRSPSLVTSLE